MSWCVFPWETLSEHSPLVKLKPRVLCPVQAKCVCHFSAHVQAVDIGEVFMGVASEITWTQNHTAKSLTTWLLVFHCTLLFNGTWVSSSSIDGPQSHARQHLLGDRELALEERNNHLPIFFRHS